MSAVSNVDSLVRAWERRAAALEPVMRAATSEATKTVYAESRKQMTALIYDKPVPTKAELRGERKGRREGAGKTFRPGKFRTAVGKGIKVRSQKAESKQGAWRRTGNLRRSEKMKIVSAYEGQITNAASTKGKAGVRGYARIRHEMGKPGRRRTRYPAPWRDKAMEAKRARVREIYREAMVSAIRGGIVGRPNL